jgi:hypothetical protein
MIQKIEINADVVNKGVTCVNGKWEEKAATGTANVVIHLADGRKAVIDKLDINDIEWCSRGGVKGLMLKIRPK